MCLENRLPTGTWVRIPHPPPHFTQEKVLDFGYNRQKLGAFSVFVRVEIGLRFAKNRLVGENGLFSPTG